MDESPNKDEKESNVLRFPGVSKIELGGPIPTQQVLEHAAKIALKSVVLVGVRPCGCLYVASSSPDVDAVIGQMERAKSFLAGIDLSGHDGGHDDDHDAKYEDEDPDDGGH